VNLALSPETAVTVGSASTPRDAVALEVLEGLLQRAVGAGVERVGQFSPLSRSG